MYAKSSEIKPYKNDYIIYSNHKNLDSVLNRDTISVISIDPAIKNFAIRAEERTRSYVRTLKFLKMKFSDSTSVYREITKLLDKYNFSEYHLCIIERQMTANYNMIRVSQHCITYFCIKYPSMVVVDVSSLLKTRALCAPSRLTYAERKKWSIEKAIQLLDKYEDHEGKHMFNSIDGKKDDVADTITQAQALFVITGYVDNK